MASVKFSKNFLIYTVVLTMILACVLSCNKSHGGSANEVGTTVGRSAFEIVGEIEQTGAVLTGFGYLTHIDDLPDDLLFTSSDTHSEGTARFTFFATANLTDRFIIGNVFIINATGTINIYFTDMPHGNFDDPTSFVGDMPIATFSVRAQSVLSSQIPDQNQGIATFTGDITQNTTNPFELGGQQYQLGKPGLIERLLFTGTGNRTEPTLPVSMIVGGGNVSVTSQGDL